MIEPMLYFWKLYVSGRDHGISDQVDNSCLSINKPTIKRLITDFTRMNLGFESPWEELSHNGSTDHETTSAGLSAGQSAGWLEAKQKLDFVKNEITCHASVISQAFNQLPEFRHFDSDTKRNMSESVLLEFMILRAAAAHCSYFKGTA